mgnify:CR=1 FL=1
MESYLKKIQDRIQTTYNDGMGFTASDFTDLADYKTISKTLERLEDAGEIRRCYSICSDRNEDMSIAIKKVDQGQFSTWANDHLKAGDVLEVMPPQGVFFQKAAKVGGQNYLGFAAGSGITPILSIVKSVLNRQADAQFTLVYGNRSWKQTMFAEQIMDLKDRFKERLQLINIFSREMNDSEIFNGRIDAEKLQQLDTG